MSSPVRAAMTKDDARVVDALARHTVRRVLFPDLRSRINTPLPTRSPVRGEVGVQQATEKLALPFTLGYHHAHVLSYASWSDAQLEHEREQLQSYLRNHTQPMRAPHGPEDEEDDEKVDHDTEAAAAREAFALLELFLRERQSETAARKQPESARLLHAQLALFAHYFEACHGRKILHDFDVVAIERTYQSFLNKQ